MMRHFKFTKILFFYKLNILIYFLAFKTPGNNFNHEFYGY